VAGSRLGSRGPLAAICGFVVVLGLWNAARYPTNGGFDAPAHMCYADGLVPGLRLPHPNTPCGGEYYTPPGFYLVAGSVDWLIKQTGYGDPDRGTQLLNAFFLLGTVLLTAAIARRLRPGRPRIELGAAAFVGFLPVVVQNSAMFHPEPMSMFLATLALWLCVRTFASPGYAWALGAVLGAAQLVRAFALWTVGAVGLALLAGRRWRELAIVVLLAVAIPAPWYVHQAGTYGGQPEFPQPAQAKKLPLAFAYGLGIPTVITDPYRPHHYSRWIPVTYNGIWGDYFGFWQWHSGSPIPGTRAVVTKPSAPAARWLRIQSLVGIVPTLLALAGWVLLVRWSIGHREGLAVALLPAVGLAGYLYYAARYWTPDGDLLKASFMLTTVSGWALGFGFALDRLRGRAWPIALVLLALCALVELPFLVY
jgi:hypothetical protein